MMMRLQQMPSDAKEVLHESVHGQESLRLPRSFKLPHLSFPLSRRFVRDFGMVTTRPPKTIVKPTALGPVANTDTKLLIYVLFQKDRVLAQDGDGLPGQRPPRTGLLAPAACYGNVKRAPIRISRGPRKPSGSPKLPAADVRVLLLVTVSELKRLKTSKTRPRRP